jgi:hypothetical protein
MLIHKPKMRVVQKALVALFAVMFGFASLTQSLSARTAPPCKCCGTDDTGAVPCPTSCCEAPVREEAPVAPASAPVNRGIDLVGLAVAVPHVVAFDQPVVFSLSTPSVCSLPLRAVPIFQRDCSYLI